MSLKQTPIIFVGGFILSIAVPYMTRICPLMSKSTPVVTISNGQIQGRVGHSLRSGKEFWQFLSIPYAKPPLGNLRFEPPVPLEEPWEGVKQVVKYPPHCVQYDALVLQHVQGVEDCLFLNVFVSSPNKNETAKSLKPVIVFIHGGGFLSSGSRTYHPDFFMDQDDLILVTFNYRLGPFGFLNLVQLGSSNNASDLSLPRGNMGLKDQRLVLQWIQQNIESFGGDPRRITIMGESAGAASVHLHILSPQSKGLFQKAVALSGSALNPWAISPEVVKVSRKFVADLGCPIESKDKMMDCLNNADAAKMVVLQQVLQNPTIENDLLVPSIEAFEVEDTFLADHPLEIMEQDRGTDVPLIIGVNSGEGGLLTARFDAMPKITGNLEDIWLSKIASFACVPEHSLTKNITEKIRHFYFGDNTTFASIEPTRFQEGFSKVASDTLFFIPAHKAAVQHARSGSPTYMYHYDYKAILLPSTYSGFRAVTPDDLILSEVKVFFTMVFDWIVEHSIGEDKGPRRFGVSHAEDLYQAWNLEGMTGYFTITDKWFSNSFIETFVDFARGGYESPLSFRGVPWPKLPVVVAEDKPLPCMLLDNSGTPKTVLEPYAERLAFWNSLGL